MVKVIKIKCNNINYRKGYIEVIPNIHEGYINLEIWNIHPDVDLSKTDIKSENFPDSGVTSNTEIEISINEAEVLISKLQDSITKAKGNI